jgi:hypothetical protein
VFELRWNGGRGVNVLHPMVDELWDTLVAGMQADDKDEGERLIGIAFSIAMELTDVLKDHAPNYRYLSPLTTISFAPHEESQL